MSEHRATRTTATAVMAVIAMASGAAWAHNVDERDAAVIAEAYHLWQTLGEDVWPGWTATPMPMVFIAEDEEFAVGFDVPPDGFEPTGQRIADRDVHFRGRQLERTLAASYDFQGVPAAIIGTPEALECSPTVWVLKAEHEMFHVLSARRGSDQKIRALGIGPEDDTAWQLDYPFPYDDANVMRLMHLQGYPIFLGITAPTDDPNVKYNAGTALEAWEVMQVYLREATGDDRAAKYAMFQEGEEGPGRYTEYRMAQLAVETGYEPLPAFAAIDGYVPYTAVWEDLYKSAPFVIKHSGRAVRTRTLFYYTGLGKCLLLDRIEPDWKHAYFAPAVWLDDLIADAVGARTTLVPIETGSRAPGFELASLDGKTISLRGFGDKVVLLDFWQWWCPPCVEAMPHLQALQERHDNAGLEVLGISDRIDDAAREQMRAAMRAVGATYPMLIDPTGSVLRDYGVNSYPTLALIDRRGVVRWTASGYTPGSEQVIEQRVLDLLQQ